MKIVCESCHASYDVDDRRIPPSGMTMKCPACLHTFSVTPGMKSAADDQPELPAPKVARPAGVPAREEVLDLPAPKAAAPKPPAATLKPPPPPQEKTPASPNAATMMPGPAPIDLVDLPAPKVARPGAPPKTPDEIVDLPAPRGAAKAPAPELQAPKRQPSGIDLDAPDPDDLGPPRVTMPATRSATPGSTPLDPESIELAVPLDIPLAAPKGDPKYQSTKAGLPPTKPPGASRPGASRPGARPQSPSDPGLDLEPKVMSLELAPKEQTLELAPKAPVLDLAPKAPVLDLTPKAPALDLAPKAPAFDLAPKQQVFDVAPKPSAGHAEDVELAPKGPQERPAAEAARAPAKTRGKNERTAVVEPLPPAARRRRSALFAVAGVGLLIGMVGIGLGIFTSSGYFGLNLFTAGHGGEEQTLTSVRKLLSDDTFASYKKAALELHPIAESALKPGEAAALEATARLCTARLGVTSELRAADALLAKLTADGKAAQLPDAQKARALRDLATPKLADARTKLAAILTATPSDAAAQVYLGWTELAAGDAAAADRAFGKALAVEPSRAQALYGAGQAKERLGENTAARELYARTLSRSPSHFGALVAQARLALPPAAARIEQLINQKGTQVGPRELAEAWATVGALAAQAGRLTDAEDRLKRALQLDPSSADARAAMARVQCDAGRAKEAIPGLEKLIAEQPKNPDARVAYLRALVETHATKLVTVLPQAVKEAPRDPRILYWVGRAAMALDPPDRIGALKAFKECVSADPKFVAAYLAESQVFAQLGKNDDALDALEQAEVRTSEDPERMLELGQAYLGLNKPEQAEARFRAALEKRPDSPPALLALGTALEAEGKLDDARVQYNAVGARSPDWPGLAERQAGIALRQGRRDAAWDLYQKALSQGVPTHALRLAAAALALDTQRYPEARRLIDSVVSEDDRSAEAHLLLGRVHLAAGHADDALVEARRAAMLSDLPAAHLVLAQALERLGKLDQSANEYQLARRPPVVGEAALGRARVLVRLGASRDALAEAQALYHDKNLRARALLVSGDAYADLQVIDKSRHAYEDAAKADPLSADAAFKYGRSLHDAGRRRPSIVELERAVSMGGDKAPWLAEAWLILGDAHREQKENDAAIKAYRRYLTVAPSDAAARVEVNRQLSILGAK